jgi:hypothetical protein
VAFFGALAVPHFSSTPLNAAHFLGIRYFAVYAVFEFCGVLKGFVYDFSASACQFESDVFNDDFAVMLSVYERFRVTQFLLLGFLFRSASVACYPATPDSWSFAKGEIVVFIVFLI